MKRTIKVLRHSDVAKVVINEQGDCYDLIACEDCHIPFGMMTLVSLGVSIKLPSGCVAKIYDRSSTPRKRGYKLANSVGYIDNSYSGNEDIWKYQAQSITQDKIGAVIKAGDRICQFEICLSSRATVLDKLKWLFTSGYRFEYVDNLADKNRGGFGSTGDK